MEVCMKIAQDAVLIMYQRFILPMALDFNVRSKQTNFALKYWNYARFWTHAKNYELIKLPFSSGSQSFLCKNLFGKFLFSIWRSIFHLRIYFLFAKKEPNQWFFVCDSLSFNNCTTATIVYSFNEFKMAWPQNHHFRTWL